MKKLLLLVPLMFCCAPKTVDIVGPPEPPLDNKDMYGVISLLSMESIGHACPVEGEVYTAKHNVYDSRMPERYQKIQGFSWEDGYGEKGVALTKHRDVYYDLAVLKVTGSPTYYHRGENPENGDKVRWVEFSKEEDKVFTQEVKEGKVIHSIAGYIFVDTPPIPGASGSCLIDGEGKAIGIVVWGVLGTIGVAVELP